MKRMIALVLALGLIVGCQKKTETQQAAQPQQQAQTSTANQATPSKPNTERQKPAMRPSDARIVVESPTVSKGQKGNFKIKYYATETAKAIVIPLKVPDGMVLDSVSWAGSMLSYLANKPVRLNNDAHTLLLAAIPVTEPRIPAKEGLIGSVYFTMKNDAVSGTIQGTFVPPGNYLMYVDSLGGGAEPNYEGGQVTVK